MAALDFANLFFLLCWLLRDNSVFIHHENEVKPCLVGIIEKSIAK